MTALSVSVDRYLRHVSIERGLAENTLQAYRRDLVAYLGALTRRGVETPEGIAAADVAAFAHELRTRAESPLTASSMARMLSPLKVR